MEAARAMLARACNDPAIFRKFCGMTAESPTPSNVVPMATATATKQKKAA